MPFATGHGSGNCAYLIIRNATYMYIGYTPNKPNLILNDVSIAVVNEVKDLGVVVIDSCLN
jgi:hypothetical protein